MTLPSPLYERYRADTTWASPDRSTDDQHEATHVFRDRCQLSEATINRAPLHGSGSVSRAEPHRQRLNLGARVEFKSTRFAGNATLVEILNDPNTGTKKLAKGSPHDAVRAVQQALLDLHWVKPWRSGDHVLVVSQFVDGDYGPWTSETVLAYRRHYDIHFPPDAPVGTYDGFTGPATLKSLDGHCVLLDEADAAIRARADELIANGLRLEFTPADGAGRTLRPLRRSAGADRGATIGGEVAAMVYKRDVGAFELHGPVYVEWVKQEFASGTGEAMGVIGFPVSDTSVSDSVMTAVFERGTISHDVSSGLTAVDVDPAVDVLRHEIEF